ncbi:hypothetical protein [Streptomyces antarcticus]|uniref:hypothetical protein n=1 Tax=Streptomyces antarcticus TaxID=2996458 RepID=UPI002271796D|nr:MULTISPECIES: hypothetical protein [unclassified Streptomyces]MCY0947453.1 hypothetical protein [Streptomyces sp. H34-AA3]MCZ4088521.1 hypothetical protein [Streptomyces sp. H34-S5]
MSETPVAPVPTADLYDEHGEDLALCTTGFRPFGGRRLFADGPVRTLARHEDDALLRELVHSPEAEPSSSWTAAAR